MPQGSPRSPGVYAVLWVWALARRAAVASGGAATRVPPFAIPAGVDIPAGDRVSRSVGSCVEVEEWYCPYLDCSLDDTVAICPCTCVTSTGTSSSTTTAVSSTATSGTATSASVTSGTATSASVTSSASPSATATSASVTSRTGASSAAPATTTAPPLAATTAALSAASAPPTSTPASVAAVGSSVTTSQTTTSTNEWYCGMVDCSLPAAVSRCPMACAASTTTAAAAAQPASGAAEQGGVAEGDAEGVTGATVVAAVTSIGIAVICVAAFTLRQATRRLKLRGHVFCDKAAAATACEKRPPCEDAAVVEVLPESAPRAPSDADDAVACESHPEPSVAPSAGKGLFDGVLSLLSPGPPPRLSEEDFDSLQDSVSVEHVQDVVGTCPMEIGWGDGPSGSAGSRCSVPNAALQRTRKEAVRPAASRLETVPEAPELAGTQDSSWQVSIGETATLEGVWELPSCGKNSADDKDPYELLVVTYQYR